MSKWGDISRAVMISSLIESEKQGLSPEETAMAIDAAYPFGERSHHPYKVWLNERKLFFAKHGLPRNGDYRSAKERIDDLVARMSAQRGWVDN